MSDKARKSALLALASLLLIGCACSVEGSAGKSDPDSFMTRRLQIPVRSMTLEMGRNGLLRAHMKAGGIYMSVLKDALISGGFEPCDITDCDESVLLEVEDQGLLALVTIKTSKITLSQLWDFSSGSPRPYSQPVAMGV